MFKDCLYEFSEAIAGAVIIISIKCTDFINKDKKSTELQRFLNKSAKYIEKILK